MEKINLTFDEPSDSKVAQDYSGNGNNATLTVDYFTQGRQGNSLFSFHNASTTVPTNPIDFNANFTIYFFAYSEIYINHLSTLVFYITFSGTTQVLKMLINTDASSWTFIALTRTGNVLKTYMEGVEQDNYTIPVEFGAIEAVICARDYAGPSPIPLPQEGILLDEFVGLDQALTSQQLKTLIVNYSSTLAYEINGTVLATIGVNVKDIRGHVGLPEVKNQQEINWPEEHGILLRNPARKRYNRRVIELDIFFKASSRDEAIDRTLQLKQLVSTSPYQRFVFWATSRFVPYDVQVIDAFNFEIPKWFDSGTMVSGTLTMIEEIPVKKVLKFVRTGESNKRINIGVNTNKHQLMIFWGDGTYTSNVNGAAATVSHDYSVDGEYLINVYGVIESLTDFTHNAIEVWPRYC